MQTFSGMRMPRRLIDIAEARAAIYTSATQGWRCMHQTGNHSRRCRVAWLRTHAAHLRSYLYLYDWHVCVERRRGVQNQARVLLVYITRKTQPSVRSPCSIGASHRACRAEPQQVEGWHYHQRTCYADSSGAARHTQGHIRLGTHISASAV